MLTKFLKGLGEGMSHRLSSKTETYHFMPDLEPQPCPESNFSHSSKDYKGDLCLSMKANAASTTLFVFSSIMTLSNVPSLWELGELGRSQSPKRYIRSSLHECSNLGIQNALHNLSPPACHLSFAAALRGPHLLKLSPRLLPLTSSCCL